jgi:large subunit ribosomal protein L18
MARNSTYRVKLRRRREGKTDYHARKAMVVSERPRLVPRFSAKNVSIQIIISKVSGDVVIAAAHSSELKKKYGWKAPTGNIPAAYLTGLICGFRAKNKTVKNAILDIGLVNPSKGSKVFAALSGVIDAGIDIPHDEKKIIKVRLEGKHIASYGSSLESDSDAYSTRFAKYLEQKLSPQDLPEHFSKIKSDIISSFKKGDKKHEL